MINKKIKTIIFDLGGVIFTSGTHLTVAKIVEKYHIQDEEALKLFFNSDHDHEGGLLRLGLISMDEFERRFYLKFKIKEEYPQQLRMMWYSNYIPYYSMLNILKKLSKQYRLVAFTGNIQERIKFLDSRYNFLKFFHKSLFSYDYHYSKQDQEFYNELLNHINCEPSEALLIDDSYEVIEIARSLKLHTLLFSYTEQFVEEMLNYGIKVEF
ncbi:MAG: HAD family hydrolase [Candidatus Thorarchaeota archaeon]